MTKKTGRQGRQGGRGQLAGCAGAEVRRRGGAQAWSGAVVGQSVEPAEQSAQPRRSGRLERRNAVALECRSGLQAASARDGRRGCQAGTQSRLGSGQRAAGMPGGWGVARDGQAPG
ncbi:hypothetical protein GZ77_26365 [Endozoicomonas montiporae]|uniref:Uncharacterized protein n=1 Tax=Endozoicomonas montiporae TaxID=1027273 RepID=A0A081MYK2_9GAMM|nr:hypothetical protein GZ77_26365 [Endozoicomonas montiporae]